MLRIDRKRKNGLDWNKGNLIKRLIKCDSIDQNIKIGR
mgnify:CR=1 FL=1|jgi:hypothetical protein